MFDNFIPDIPIRHISIMSKEDAEDFHSHLISKPTDRLEVSDDLSDRLVSIIRNITGQKPDDEGFYRIPVDILFADTIPLKSVEFTLHSVVGRVTLFDDDYRHNELQQIVNGVKKRASIGIVSLYVPINKTTSTIEVFCVIYADTDIDTLVVTPDLGFKGNKTVSDLIYSNRYDMINSNDISNIFTAINNVRYLFTSYWYSVNILLQNPVIKECISTGREPVQQRNINKRKGGKQPPKKYIRRLYIDTNKMDRENIIINTKPKSSKTKPLWYVTGHWRQYSSGKRIFIQGYWKGAARNLKECNTRDRELVFN